MAVFTNVGLTLFATALQTNGAQTAITYVSIGLGAGTLSAGLTSGSNYTSLSLNSALTVNIAVGQNLTIVDSLGDSQVVVATGSLIGATSIGVQNFMATANYAIGSGVVNTPGAGDTALQTESVRVAATAGAAGANPGESLNSGYFDPTTASATYLEVGYYGGSAATSSTGTGILMARDVQFWAHTTLVDSAAFQLDTTI